MEMTASNTEPTTSKPRKRTVLKLYFLLTTIAGIIGTLVSLGGFLYAIGKKLIITNDEYIVAERYYELDICSNTYSKAVPGNPNAMATPTEAEIAKCKADKKVTLIEARNALFKEDMLSGGIWSLLFLILLFTHYPRFMRLNKKPE